MLENGPLGYHCPATTNQSTPSCRSPGLHFIFALLAIGAIPLFADTVIVESKIASGSSQAAITPDPPYKETAGFWSYSTSKSTAPGCTPGIGSRFGTAIGAEFRITPTLAIAGDTYFVDITCSSNAQSTNVLVTLSAVGGTLSTNSTTAFQFSRDNTNVWVRVGTIQLFPGTNAPAITFTATTGTVARFYADAVRFVNTKDLCVNTPQLANVVGPLAAGQTSVMTPGVDGSASAITIYADGIQIGQKIAGIVAGINSVSTTPLAKGQTIIATQTKDGSESCKSLAGPKVGGGANPRIRIALIIRQNTGLTGPIGANGGTASNKLVLLGSSGVVSGASANAPSGGKVIFPDTCWQTVSFLRGPDSSNPVDATFTWAGADGRPLEGNFGVLESIAFAADDLTDSGPFQLYIDNLRNGSTLIQDFETASAGTSEVIFRRPGSSATTAGFLLSPDISQVSNANADTGTNSALIGWQFLESRSDVWLRLTTQGSGSGGTPNPEVDLNQPISFRILLLPVGQTMGNASPVIVSQSASQNYHQDEQVTLSVGATGPVGLHYQWFHDGAAIANATGASYQILHFQTNDIGVYGVAVIAPSSSCTVTGQPIVLGLIGEGNGLVGDYYADDGTHSFNDPPLLSRVDAAITFDWTATPPDPRIPPDHFLVRWSGLLQPLTTETYTFYIDGDVGVRLWIGGVKVIDHWAVQPAASSGSLALIGGQKYEVRLEYYDNDGGEQVVVLNWFSPTQLDALVPESQLYAMRPVLVSQPADSTAECAGSTTLSSAATGPGYLSYQWQRNGGAIPGAVSSNYTITAIQCGDIGSTYSVLVRNGAGSVTSSIVTLSVVDTIPPVITCPANIQMLADPIACSAVVAYAATADDACNGLSLSCDPPSGSTFPTGTWTVHCAAVDCGHNAADCSFNVEIMGPGTPMLSIAYQNDGGILLCWPITCRTYVLQHKANLISAPGWTAVNLPSNESNGQHCTRIQGPLEQTAFYRLFSP